MKQLICIALLLALLLTGCTVSESTGDTCRVEDPIEVEETVGQDPEPEEEPEPDKTPEPEAEPQPESESAPSGTTASGVTVHTDYSNYTPHTTPDPVFTRLTQEHIPDLQPSDDYGMLYPYIGSLLWSVGDNGYSYQSGEMYGFVDETGRIVADATYMSIDTMSYYDMTQYKSVEVPMLSFTRPGEVTLVEGDGWSYYDHETLYGVASLDGSFVLPCEYGYVTALGCGVLVMEKYQSEAFTLYDFEGNVLLTERDLSLGDKRLEYSYSSLQYSEGYFVIDLSDGRWVMDFEGNLLHGPYYDVRQYSSGVAPASLDGTNYGFVDYEGNWVVPPEYRWTYSAYDGTCVAQSERGEIDLFDAQGNERFHIRADYCNVTNYGYSAGSYNTSVTRYYDHNGELLFESTGGDWYEVGYLGNVFVRSTNTGIELMNIVTGATAAFEGDYSAGGIHTGGIDFTPLDVPYVFVSNYSNSELPVLLLHEDDFSVLVESPGNSYWGGLSDPATGEQYMVEYDYEGGRYTLFDEAVNELVTLSAVPMVYNGMLRTTDNHFCTWQDFDGNVLFRYSLAASLSD